MGWALLPCWHRLSPAQAVPCTTPTVSPGAELGTAPSTAQRGSPHLPHPGGVSQIPREGVLWDLPQHRRETCSSEGRDEVKTQLPLLKTRPRVFCSQYEMS